MRDWHFIVNPTSAFGLAKEEWERLKSLLNREKIKFSNFITKYPLHAVDIAMNLAKNGIRKIAVVGGDGTVNEVVNGLIKSGKNIKDFFIAIFPIGRGNDLIKSVGIPEDHKTILKAIKDEKKFVTLDLGKVEYFSSKNEKQTRYFVNVAGLAFDAVVTKLANEIAEKFRKRENRKKTKKANYFPQIFKKLISYKTSFVEIKLDNNKIYTFDLFTMNIGIGKYNGGGMKQVPHADPFDGLLSLTIIPKMNILRILWNLRRLYDGSIIEHPKVIAVNSKEVEIKGFKNQIGIEIDGEFIGYTPAKFTVIPKSVNFLVV